MDWQVNDMAVCLVGIWFDSDGYPLMSFPPSGPDLGQMLAVSAIRRHPDFGSLDLRFRDWPDAWFDAIGFRRIPPPVRRQDRRVSLSA